jgi:hypothetical protein
VQGVAIVGTTQTLLFHEIETDEGTHYAIGLLDNNAPEAVPSRLLGVLSDEEAYKIVVDVITSGERR